MNTSSKLMPIICILLAFALVLLILNRFDGKKEYSDNIKRANAAITELEEGIANSEAVAKVLKEAADAAKLNADNRIAELELAEKQRKARYAREIRELRAEIATMPPDEIVTETRAELGREDIYKMPDGVKFSFEASRANLKILSEFSLVWNDREEVQASLDEFKLAVVDFKSAIANLEGVIITKDKVIFGKDEIIGKWSDKFDLCEKNRKQKWLDGLIKGSLGMLAIITFFKIIGGK